VKCTEHPSKHELCLQNPRARPERGIHIHRRVRNTIKSSCCGRRRRRRSCPQLQEGEWGSHSPRGRSRKFAIEPSNPGPCRYSTRQEARYVNQGWILKNGSASLPPQTVNSGRTRRNYLAIPLLRNCDQFWVGSGRSFPCACSAIPPPGNRKHWDWAKFFYCRGLIRFVGLTSQIPAAGILPRRTDRHIPRPTDSRPSSFLAPVDHDA